ncbi:MAG TPA: biotin/lipoyl-containing protein [Prolixibacteraceae bacterium]|nr:biotin/lipoyl-containing protein [Prolixibacteraceae bacterium]
MDKFKFKIEGTEYEVVINGVENKIASVEVNGKSYTVEIVKEEVERTPIRSNPAPQRQMTSAPIASPRKPVASGGGKALNSPLPGTIIKVNVTVGQQVKTGEIVLTMESMKMENNILAHCDGIIKAISVTAGQSVMQGESLVEIG